MMVRERQCHTTPPPAALSLFAVGLSGSQLLATKASSACRGMRYV
jgi:hypothetical protein